MNQSEQYEILSSNIRFVELVRPCTLGDGIVSLNSDQEREYITIYEENKKEEHSSFFIPASGAASRMFKDIYGNEAPLKTKFLEHVNQFPFYHFLVDKYQSLSDNISFEDFVIAYVSSEMSLLPKGLIYFSYSSLVVKTAFEEHIQDAEELFTKQASIHFTVPEKYIPEISELFTKTSYTYEQKKAKKIDWSLSVQKKETDTISIHKDGTLVLQPDGSAYTRPAGHGALLSNLNDLTQELIFIHNIDNTSTIANRGLNTHIRKVMAGYLLNIKEQVFTILKNIQLEPLEKVWSIQELALFKEIGISITPTNKQSTLDVLNKPIRVCGVVKNDGQPGGGPFWIRNQSGVLSKQIVESAEVDLQNPKQKEIFESSSHFNPVNMVCYKHDWQGNKFDLTKFSDQSRSLVTHKSHDGKEVKVLEYPGLWNGSMEHWITIFIEIPSETFKPVKTVFDLLKK